MNEINPVEKRKGGLGGLLGKIIGGVAGAVAAPFTGGASIPAGIGLGSEIGSTVGNIADPMKVNQSSGPRQLDVAAQHIPEVKIGILDNGIEALKNAPLDEEEKKQKMNLFTMARNKVSGGI